MPRPSLVLIGFMGSGKTSAGRALARRLQLRRFDTDEMVSAKFGMSVGRIFEELGETRFREAETAALSEIPPGRAVIVTGGGVILRSENRDRCRALGTVALLSCDEETVFQRITRRPLRPLLQTANPRSTLSELLARRQPLYRSLADFEIDTSRLNHTEVVDALIERWALAPECSDVR